jgi:hypothetical protein
MTGGSLMINDWGAILGQVDGGDWYLIQASTQPIRPAGRDQRAGVSPACRRRATIRVSTIPTETSAFDRSVNQNLRRSDRCIWHPGRSQSKGRRD